MPPTGGMPLPPPGMRPLPPPQPMGPPPMYPGMTGPQQLPYGTRFGYGPYPAKKSNAGAIVAVAIFGVVILAAGAILVVGLSSGKNRRVAEAGYSTPYSTDYTTPTDSSTYTTSSDPSTTERSTEATTERSSQTQETRAPAGPQPAHKLEDNPLLMDADTGLQNAPCELSKWANNPEASAAFFRSARPCLDRVWQTALGDANLPFEVPDIQFPSGTSWSSPCGGADNGRVSAFYCSQNQTLYMPFGGLQVPQYGARPGVYLAVFAHEYGHHAQTMSGIMDAYWDARYDAGQDSAAGLELSRRAELMAQCFSGMFLGSTANRGGDVNQAIFEEAWASEDRGDHNGPPRDHGSDEHYISWWQQGATKNRFAQCNTFNTASANVS